MLVSEAKMKQLGLTPRAKIITRVVVGSDPVYMLDGTRLFHVHNLCND